MKRIGIVSRVHGINYGAILQAVALQEVLERHESVYAEYINFEVEVPQHGLHKLLSWSYSKIRLLLGFRQRIVRTNLFLKRYLHLSKKIYNYDELIKQMSTYNILMAGSDQIWNPRYYPLSNGLYLLNCSNNNIPKVSYASSFGVRELSASMKKAYQKALRDFLFLSVREQHGEQIIQDMNIHNVRTDIDPTLLLSSDEWAKHFNKIPVEKRPFICCYVMNGAEELNKYIVSQAEELQSRQKEKPIIIILGDKEYKGFFSNHKYIRTAGPCEFLNYLYYAQYVLTSSFHGTCFSIIFKKNFYTILDKSNEFNSRMENLLTSLQLNDRIMYKQDYALKIKPNVIDYQKVYFLLQKEQTKSLTYLNMIIEYMFNPQKDVSFSK